MARDQREVTESPLDQGVGESTAYRFDFADSGAGIVAGLPAFQFVREDGVDLSAICLLGGTIGTVIGLIATSPIVTGLQAGQNYRLYARITHDGGQVMELYCDIRGRQ